MRLLEKHREDYKSLSKRELFLIIEESLELNRKRIERNIYNPLSSKRNNNRASLRKFLKLRNNNNTQIREKSRKKIAEKIKILREVTLWEQK